MELNKVISIDLGGTNLRVGIVDENLNILSQIKEKSIHEDPNLLYLQIKKMVNEVLSSSFSSNINKIGICCAGFINNGRIENSPNLNIKGFDLIPLLQKDFPFINEIKLVNDANCEALMEAKYGASKDFDSSIFLTISTGIGIGVVNSKQLIDLPFEVGHNYINYKNNFYEFEQLCSGNGVIYLSKLNDLNITSSQEFFLLVKSKDEKALKVYEDWLRLTSSFIANMQLNYNSDVYVLSGGVLKSKEVFLEDLEKVSNAFIANYPCKKIKFVLAKFDQDCGLISGASLVL